MDALSFASRSQLGHFAAIENELGHDRRRTKRSSSICWGTLPPTNMEPDGSFYKEHGLPGSVRFHVDWREANPFGREAQRVRCTNLKGAGTSGCHAAIFRREIPPPPHRYPVRLTECTWRPQQVWPEWSWRFPAKRSDGSPQTL